MGTHPGGWTPWKKARGILGGAITFSHKPNLIQADCLPVSQARQMAQETGRGRLVELLELELPAAAQFLHLITCSQASKTGPEWLLLRTGSILEVSWGKVKVRDTVNSEDIPAAIGVSLPRARVCGSQQPGHSHRCESRMDSGQGKCHCGCDFGLTP